MGYRREFEIAFVGLKPGIHEYKYEVDHKFFANYSQADFTNCQASIHLKLDKNTSFMMLKFEIGGSVNVICDRCGNTLNMDLWDEFNMVIKQVENPDEMKAAGQRAQRVIHERFSPAVLGPKYVSFLESLR